MIQTKKRTFLWLTGGLVFSLLVLLVVSTGLSGNVLITDPEGIPETTDAVMNCIRSGDWMTLEGLVTGNPALAPVTGEEGTAENLIWNAYQQSLQWVYEEEFDIQDSYVIQTVTVTCLDISGVTGIIARILQEPAFIAANSESALLAATEEVLHADVPTIQKEITLTLARENGRWLVVPNSALLALLSGFTAH